MATTELAAALNDYDYVEITATGTVPVPGEDPATVDVVLQDASLAGDADVFFVLVSGYLVFFMQCGFAMLSVGSVRSKNAKNIILKNLLDACFGAIFFYLLGYGFAYGGDLDDTEGNKFIGYAQFALHQQPKSLFHSWFFQFAFAATAATIVSGAVAERCKFEGYILYAILLTSWVYPIVVHWVWSTTGWASSFIGNTDDLLFSVGVIDFAGCGVVHMVGGLSAFAGAAIIGPRVGRYDADGRPNTLPGHNASLAILGVFILWFGWYGFNPGSALGISGLSSVAALCAVTTTLSAAAGTLSTLLMLMIMELMSTGEIVWDLIGASNGTLAGLVGITAACSVVEPWAAIIIGFTSGIVYVGFSRLMSHILKIDDPLDAVAVHGACGAWGLIMAAAFSHEPNYLIAYGTEGVVGDRADGFIMGGDGRLLASALVLILAITGWVLGHMIPFFFVMRMLGLLRVDEAEERAGLDVSHHGGSAYETPSVAVTGKGSNDSDALLSRVQYLEQQVKAMRALPVETS